MANLNAGPSATILSKLLPRTRPSTQSTASKVTSSSQAAASKSKAGLKILGDVNTGRNRRKAPVSKCSNAHVGEMGILGIRKRREGLEDKKYLVREYGWGVRRMVKVGDEMRSVAYVQAEAFHEPVAFFNDIFFDFFKAEVLSALFYRVSNSALDRYACLVAESLDEERGLVGVADATVQRDEDVLRHLQGDVDEYLYVSGIAVLKNFRRRRVATAILKACDELSVSWGFKYLALRAYEDDEAARKLYANAGYVVVSGDPHWIALVGKKRRVLMIKPIT